MSIPFGCYCAVCKNFLGNFTSRTMLHHQARTLCGPCYSIYQRVMSKQPVEIIRITAAEKV